MNWLGLPGFEAEIPRHIVNETGRLAEVLIEVRPIDTTYPACCPNPKLVKNGTKAVRYRDRRRDPAPTWLVVKRQRMKCHNCGATLYQQVPHVDEDHYITDRLRDDIILAASKRPFRDVVATQAVEETLVRRVFRKFADEALKDYRFDAPRVLGIDDNHILGRQCTIVMDVETGLLLDIYPGANKSAITKGLSRMDKWENVEVWCQDMANAYRGVAQEHFPNAKIVIDKFHVVMKANRRWNDIRVAESPKLPGDIRQLLSGTKRSFDKHWEDLSRESQNRVSGILSLNARMEDAYAIKETFYYFYDKATRQEAEEAYTRWVRDVRSRDRHKDWEDLMRTVARNRKEIFNYFDHRFTSGKVERMNRSIADINRAGNGMDFETLRAKALLRYGRMIPPEDFTFYCIDGPPPPPIPWPEPIISTPFAG